MLPSVLKRLAAATSKRARSVCGEDARAAARSASELPGKTVDDKKADTQRAQRPPSPARNEVIDSIIERWKTD